jgi:glycosyltransferase involved in cell wall biosynthesis
VRVLHVIPRLSFRCGGPVKALSGLAAAQVKAGLEVRILSTDYGHEEYTDIPGCEIKIFPCRTGRWQWSPSLSKALPDEVRWADIVNVHTLWSYATWASARACRAARVPYVLRPCGMLDTWSLAQKRLKKKVYASIIEARTVDRAAALWFATEEERASAKAFNYQSEDFVTPLGVSLEEFPNHRPRGSFRERFLHSSDDRVLLFLGRITPVKHLDLLLRSYAEVAASMTDTILVMAGPDENGHVHELQRLAAVLGIADKVVFTGGLQREDVPAALADADVFVYPSRHESFGLAVIEAMAAGLPVIVSDQVGLAGFVSEAKAGIVITPKKEELASAMRSLLSNPSAAREMGRRGSDLVREKFGWESIVPKITDAYESAIRASRNGHN